MNRLLIAVAALMLLLAPAHAADYEADYKYDCTPGTPGCPVPRRQQQWHPWQAVWQCNDIRLTIAERAPGVVVYDIGGSIWGGSNIQNRG